MNGLILFVVPYPSGKNSLEVGQGGMPWMSLDRIQLELELLV
ncbi:MAG: hypothetical protein ACK449_11975 [Planctomycetota bacterium]